MPYGSWPSPITAAAVASDRVRLNDLQLDRDDVYWIEGRPQEAGRCVVVRHRAGRLEDVLPPPFSARTSVHEYGGGALLAVNGSVYFCNDAGRRLHVIAPGAAPEPLTPDLADSMGLKQTTGALVSEPQPDSPAVKAGIQSGDVITSVDGAAIHDARELARRIGTMAPGASVKLGLIHQGQEKTVTLTLGTLPNEKQADATPQNQREVPDSDVPKLGLTLAPASKVQGSDGNGVVVTAVADGGVAADHGFQVGDIILDVGGKTVSTPADVRKSLADARKEGKRAVLFRVKSSQGTKFVALPLGNA